ncbi:MAG: transglutaminase domain-containing protein [Propioniciclava sp.]
MRRYRLSHLTVVEYDGPVRTAHNELRMTPVTDAGQLTLENRIRVKPMTWSHVYRDHWGTHTMEMESLVDHNALNIEAVSTVERTTLEAEHEPLSWEALTDPVLADRHYEWLMQTRRTRPDADLVALADQVRTSAAPGLAAVEVGRQLREVMTYRQGITGVHSRGADAWEEKAGVCQDFAHLTVGILRRLGVPARYVSGYLVPREDLVRGESASGESHAWVEFWDDAWVPVDPTNGTDVGLEHIVVARGRDYMDVPPFKGIYSGSASSRQQVVVTITRLA